MYISSSTLYTELNIALLLCMSGKKRRSIAIVEMQVAEMQVAE